jgi:tetratricopeptide (TPR) repeat protein
VRIGIDSGPVVVGGGPGHAIDAFGDTANLAARVQATADPGTVVVTGATHRLLSGLFVVEDRGTHSLKGMEQPVQLLRVVRSSGLRGRFEAAAAAGGLTPFVGREDELRSLLTRWERAREGEGQVVTIIGEAGIGKSRLLRRFREQIADTPHTWLEAGADAFFQNTPFYPVTDLLRQSLGEGSDWVVELVSPLTAVGLKPAEAIPLLAPLLNLPLPSEYPPSPLPPEQQRRRLLATLVKWMFGSARTQPLVSVIEDLHWADPSTLELIQFLVEQGATTSLLLLYTARPEFHPPWPLRAHHAQITLNRLSARDIRVMMHEVAAQKALADETVAAVIQRTGGVPLFVEELTRAVLESGDGKLVGRSIPVTLHDSLMARLDRLGPAKEVAQVGAVIGAEFSYELLQAVHPIAESELQRALRSLTDAELLYTRGIAPDATYQFKHALIRDAAYEALLRSRRKELHRLVARTIDEKFAILKETHPEVLARHWTEAGEIEPAIAEWSRASKAAEGRNALTEAEQSYGQTLALLNLLPESTERDLRELELRLSAQLVVFLIKGWAAPETINAAERITTLAERSGNLEALRSSLAARAVGAWFAGDYPTAGALVDQALKLAQRDGEGTYLADSYWLALTVCYWRGDLAGAEQHFLAGLKSFDDPRFRQRPFQGAIHAFAYGALNAWALGRPDIARQRFAQMMAAVDRNNPGHVAGSAFFAAWLHLQMREYENAEDQAAQAIALSEQHQFPNYAIVAHCSLGAARVQLGRVTEGIALLREGMAGMGLDVRLAVSVYPMWLAEAQDRDGATLDALESIEQALEANPDELIYRPEALRVRGELRAKQEARTALAEADFRDAIALAQKMGAKLSELRATISLARLLAHQDRRNEARAMLGAIYNWFTEGFDTADLKDAKALLDELSNSARSQPPESQS